VAASGQLDEAQYKEGAVRIQIEEGPMTVENLIVHRLMRDGRLLCCDLDAAAVFYSPPLSNNPDDHPEVQLAICYNLGHGSFITKLGWLEEGEHYRG
jgi:hypothetical protein